MQNDTLHTDKRIESDVLEYNGINVLGLEIKEAGYVHSSSL